MKFRGKSIKKRVIFFDLLMILPLFLLFVILIMVVFRKNNYELNYSKLDVIEEKCNNIADRNVEIIKITNMLYLDPDINRLVSKKQKPVEYNYIEIQDKIQKKMLELTEMFPDGQYQILLLCDNGANFFQSSLVFFNDALSMEDIKYEDWYKEIEKNQDMVFFLPRYRSPVLQKLFDEDTLFAVRNIHNLNSGRHVGMVIVAISKSIWGREVLKGEQSEEETMVIDQYRKIIFSSDKELYGTDVLNNSYYEKISQHTKGFFMGNVNKKYCHIRFSDIEGTGWKYITYEPYRRIWSIYVLLLFVLGGALVLELTAIVLYNCNFISERVNRLNKNILEVSKGNLKTRISDDYEIEFQELCQNFNMMLEKIEELMKKLEEEEKEKHALEIQALQAQINPHFFHNTLVTIRFMIQMEQYEEADKAILAFSKLLRKSFSYHQKMITIRDEMAMTEEYLELMNLRYRNKFRWSITIEEGIEELGILKNVVQPLVENSISHGFNMKQEMGHIWIRAYEREGAIIIEVEDDGVGGDLEKIYHYIENQEIPKAGEQFSGIGISNIQMRIFRNFGEEYGLSVVMNSSGGITFQMKMPVIFMRGENFEYCNCR